MKILAFFVAGGIALGAVSAKSLIVTSFPILEDLTKQLVGKRKEIEVVSLIKGGSDPHIYQPTAQDAKVVAKADALIINGLGFEAGWIHKLVEASGFKGLLFEAASNVKPRILIVTKNHTKIYDPHAWHDVHNAIAYLQVILQVLSKVDPQGKFYYQSRFKLLAASLEELDQWIKAQFHELATTNLKVITTHDAFGYYGQAYNVKFLAPIGVSTAEEPSASNVANIINTIKKYGIHAILVENLANPRQIETIAQETNAKIGGVLYADSLSAPNGPAGSYNKMMQHNTKTIVQALRSTA